MRGNPIPWLTPLRTAWLLAVQDDPRPSGVWRGTGSHCCRLGWAELIFALDGEVLSIAEIDGRFEAGPARWDAWGRVEPLGCRITAAGLQALKDGGT